jgi:hypothetical protein
MGVRFPPGAHFDQPDINIKSMKKIIAVSFLFLFLFLIISPIAHGAGLVPCGEAGNPCRLCHIFVMFNTVYTFVLRMVAIIATLMIVIGGMYFLLAGGRPEMLKRGKDILTAAAIGLLIIFGAWLIINTVFAAIGVSAWTGLEHGWFQVQNCP